MSFLNNVYGKTNLCPAVMNDGRGVETNYQNSHDITENLRKNMNTTTSADFRTELQKRGQSFVDGLQFNNVKNFGCNPSPAGEVKLNKEIKLDNGPNESYTNAFGSLLG